MSNYDSRSADKFVVRLPDGMRLQVQDAAATDDRSINSLVIKALREYLQGQQEKQALLGALVLAGNLVPANTTEFDIDEHVRLVADAKRYRWLRDVAATTGSGHTPMVKVAGGPGRWRAGEDLDQSIDQAMRCWPEQQDEEQKP